jgi:hypothetical protein
MRYAALAVVLSVLSIGLGASAADTPSFTGTGNTCGDITWQPGVLTRFPNIGAVCQGIVERDGKLYARFDGVVQRRSGSALYIRFLGGEKVPGGDHAVLIDPPEDMVIQTSKGKFRVRDAQRGQDLTIFIPSDRFVVNVGEEIAAAEQTPIKEVVSMTEPAPEEAPAPAPQTAEAPPTPAAETPPPMEATPPPPPPVVARAPAPAPTPPPEREMPWLLILIGAAIVIAIAVIVMRSRKTQ